MEGLSRLGPIGEGLAQAIRQMGVYLTALLPTLMAALLIVLVGWVVARVVRWIVGRSLGRLGFDPAMERVRVGSLLRQAGITGKPSAMTGRLAFWVVWLLFLISAVETLGLSGLRNALHRIIAFVPDLVGASLILLVGFALAGFVRNLVVSAASAGGLLQAERLGAAFRVSVILVAVVLALEELGVKTDILIAATTAIILVVGLTAGIAFALGSRRVMSHVLAGHYLRRSLPAGDEVTVRDRRGKVAKVGAVDTLLTDGERSWSVPNAVLLEEVVDR